MTEIVERVARVIAAELLKAGVIVVNVDLGRAAIEAMRKPTAEMLWTAERQGDSEGYGHITEFDAEMVWEDMINAALKAPK